MKDRSINGVPKYVIALVASFLILLVIFLIEGQVSGNNNCNSTPAKGQFAWLSCQIKSLKLVDSIESYSILTGAILFVLEAEDRKREAEDRKKQSHRQAWQQIDGAKDIETSYARFYALQDLNEDKVSLKGLDAEGADLDGIQLEEADLQDASLQGAKLKKAQLQKAQLQEAQLQKAQLQEAQLQEANLWLANLQEVDFEKANLEGAKLGSANLQKADLYEANLRGANLQSAHLQGAILRGAVLEEADLAGADLNGADLRDVQHLSLPQVQRANNWKKAKYDNHFHPELKYLIREKEVGVNEASKQIDKLNELNEIIKKIDEAIKLISEKNQAPLQDDFSLTLAEIRGAVEDLIKKDDDFDRSAKEQMREKLADLKKGIDKRDQAKTIKRYDQEAGKWLASNRERLRERLESIEGQAALERNLEMRLPDGDSPDKVKQLYQDVDNCLKLLSDYLSKSQRPKPISEGTIKLEFPISIYLDAFRLIVERAIPEIMNEGPDKLSAQEQERLNGYLNEFIQRLRESDSCKG